MARVCEPSLLHPVIVTIIVCLGQFIWTLKKNKEKKLSDSDPGFSENKSFGLACVTW